MKKVGNFFRYIFRDSKFGKFWIKAHLQYLALAGLMYGIKAGLYFLIAYIPADPIYFHHTIDSNIPLVPFFYFFYLLYYIVPEIFIWILSFFDRKKAVTIVVAGVSSTIIACIVFLIQQVKMARPEAEMLAYSEFSSVHNLNDLFKYGINWQYHADETALNCFPSLHATVGMALAMVGLWTGKDEKHFPIGLRIFCTLFGFGIVMSTFFVKQHYFVDAIMGAFLFTFFYFQFKWFFVPLYLARKEAKLAKLEEKKLEA